MHLTKCFVKREISLRLSPVLSNLTPMHCCAGWTSSSWPHKRWLFNVQECLELSC